MIVIERIVFNKSYIILYYIPYVKIVIYVEIICQEVELITTVAVVVFVKLNIAELR